MLVRLRNTVFLFALCLTIPAAAKDCRQAPIALQVLGSGGPIADDNRAAAGYLLWIGGRSRILLDAGGGVFLRFGESGAKIEDLEVVALTHLHTDHVTDLPAILKGGYFSKRSRPLKIAGPSGNQLFPDIGAFILGSFGPEQGTYRYLSGFLDGSDGLFGLESYEVDAGTDKPLTVLKTGEFTLLATGVHHGPVPTLGYRIDVHDGKHRASIAISGDQNLSTPYFTDLAKDADLMVMPFAIPENAGRGARSLHGLPSDIGKAAHEAKAKHLVLSHFMARSLNNLDTNLGALKAHYTGPVTLAEDLDCIALP